MRISTNHNGLIGIAYLGADGGTADNNECAFNSIAGIVVAATTNPQLGYNNCHDNDEADISDLRQ